MLLSNMTPFLFLKAVLIRCPSKIYCYTIASGYRSYSQFMSGFGPKTPDLKNFGEKADN